MAEKSTNVPRPPRGPRGRGVEKPKDAVGTFKRLLVYFKDYIVPIAIGLICVAISSLANVASNYFLKPIINEAIIPFIGHENPDLTRLIQILLTMLAIYIAGTVATYFQRRLLGDMAAKVQEKIRTNVFDHMQTLPLKYYDTHSTGDMMSRFTNDIGTLRMMLSQSMPQLLSSVITFVGVFITMLFLSWKLMLIVIVMLIIMTLALRVITKHSVSYFIKQQRVTGEVNGYIQEMIDGQKVIKVFNHEDTAIHDFDGLNDELNRCASNAQFLGGIMWPLTGNLAYLQYAIISVVGAGMVISGTMDVGTIGSFLQYSRTVTQPLNMITQQASTILNALAGAERIFALLDADPEVDEGTITLVNVKYGPNGELLETEERTDIWGWKETLEDGSTSIRLLKGDVRFDHVTFAYEEGHPVLNDISLYAKPGQKIAFVGSTGAGKTTITNLINRFYDVQEGTITYDGFDVKKIKKDDLRHSLAMVLQDTHLFTGTVMDNIRYGRLDATDDECIAAAKLANADFFISHLPQGYQTMITGDGENLSQGQRQLLAIARAAVADPPVLILDEATSSIDTRTERLIELGMDGLMKGRTVFVIAHRLSTVRNSNAIMVLEHGKIIERGDHDSLIADKGRYYQLYTGMFELS
ncbi:MAG: ABC transporter ATP-binding protein [Oscillospiraceae bacterium]|nr:ABC transporter ATP-binding protein [Oscillospiraceae bacterium]